MKISRKDLVTAVALSAGVLLGIGTATAQTPPVVSAEQIAKIVASPDRSDADRTNDRRRKPEQQGAPRPAKHDHRGAIISGQV